MLSFVAVVITQTNLIAALKASAHNQHPVLIAHRTFKTNAVSLVGLLILMLFFKVFIDVGLSFYVSNLFEKKEVGFFASIGKAFSRFFVILKWVIINYLVGVFINAVRGRRGLLGSIFRKLFADLLSLAWTILTFFVIPIMALEDLGIIDTIKLSGQTMKKTFGENVGATFALGTANFILGSIVSILCWVIGGIGWMLLFPSLSYNPDIALIFTAVLVGIIVLPIVLVFPITSAANIIFKVASYKYAQGKPTGPFSTQMIKDSFAAKVTP